MIAYSLLVHRYPAQFKRLFKAIYLPGNRYVVHVENAENGSRILTLLKRHLQSAANHYLQRASAPMPPSYPRTADAAFA
jgi:hypothetical protein